MTLGSLNQTYNGTARSATATTSPAGLTVNLTYNGAPIAPTNAGSYTVIGTINNLNYQGSATEMLVINLPPLIAPTLEIIPQSGSVQLRWPVIYSNHYLLSSEALTGGSWITNTSAQTITGSNIFVTLPATNSGMFYRLKAGE